MTNNVEPADSAVVSSPTREVAVAPSCYRVSVVSGSLEVSARLKNADDLELLMKVLEANKDLFPKVERSTTETIMKATKTACKSEANGVAKADLQTETLSRVA
jgi:hypothetical protein